MSSTIYLLVVLLYYDTTYYYCVSHLKVMSTDYIQASPCYIGMIDTKDVDGVRILPQHQLYRQQ